MDIKRRMFLGVVALALAGLATAQQSQPEQIVVPLTRPDKPGKLIIERHQGSISVKGYEGNVVLVKAFLRRSAGTAPSDRDAEGLKPVSAAAIQLDAHEVDNVVTVDTHSRNKSIDLEIWVPIRFSLKLGVVDDGDVIEVGDLRFTVLHTPGHSPGGISLYGHGVAFVGDTLFNFSIGRTDFPGCSHRQLMDSIETKLMTLPDDTIVYPGHGPKTTIRTERQHNPFLVA